MAHLLHNLIKKSYKVLIMKYLVILLFCVAQLFSLEPVVKITELPSMEVLEAYEDNEELFAMKVMEYYKASVMLSTQLENLGFVPDEKFKALSLEELSDMELDLIVRYYNIAKSLQGQVESITGAEKSNKVNELKKRIVEIEGLYADSIWEVRNTSLLKQLEMKNKIEAECYEKISLIEEALKNNCSECVNFLSLAITENVFLGNFNQQLESKPNLGVKVYLNASKPFGFGRSFEFWYEYQAPRFTTSFNYGGGSVNQTWNSSLNTIGLSTRFFPIPLTSSNEISSGIRLGAGYFWASGKMYNNEIATFSHEGMKVELEFFGGFSDYRYPIDLFLNLGLLQSFKNDLTFDLGNKNNLAFGKTMFNISVGLRYNFWTSLY